MTDGRCPRRNKRAPTIKHRNTWKCPIRFLCVSSNDNYPALFCLCQQCVCLRVCLLTHGNGSTAFLNPALWLALCVCLCDQGHTRRSTTRPSWSSATTRARRRATKSAVRARTAHGTASFHSHLDGRHGPPQIFNVLLWKGAHRCCTFMWQAQDVSPLLLWRFSVCGNRHLTNSVQ